MIAAMVAGYSWSDASASDGEETIDASLARRVFQLAQGLDGRLSKLVGCDGWDGGGSRVRGFYACVTKENLTVYRNTKWMHCPAS